MKRYAAHASLITLMGVVALHTKAASADPNSLLYAFIGADEVTSGPLEPAALAQDATGDTNGDRLAAVESISGDSVGDVFFADPETDFNPSADGSSVVAPLNPSNEASPSESGEGSPTKGSTHRPFLYTVQNGDTISSIAAQNDITSDTIRFANGLQNTDTINPGDVLIILTTTGALHPVQKNETVSSIAQKYDVSAAEIIAYNGLSEDGDINVGEHLTIPGATMSQPAQHVAQKPDEEPTTPSGKPSVIPLPPSSTQTPNQLGLVWPTVPREISQAFSPGRHTGDDIRGGGYVNAPIFAAKAGTVEFAGRVGGYGNFIIVDHGKGVVTRYAHLKQFAVKAGDKVSQGQVMGIMGTTGRSTGVHLHFEILINGRFINPLSQYR